MPNTDTKLVDKSVRQDAKDVRLKTPFAVQKYKM